MATKTHLTVIGSEGSALERHQIGLSLLDQQLLPDGQERFELDEGRVILRFDPQEKVEHLVYRIIDLMCEMDLQIDTLDLIGHGSGGVLTLAPQQSISIGNFDALQPFHHSLVGARLRLLGCNVAAWVPDQDSARIDHGPTLMLALSQMLSVEVSAPSGYLRVDDHFDHNGFREDAREMLDSIGVPHAPHTTCLRRGRASRTKPGCPIPLACPIVDLPEGAISVADFDTSKGFDASRLLTRPRGQVVAKTAAGQELLADLVLDGHGLRYRSGDEFIVILRKHCG
ncbi:MAG: hypothetical protein AAFN74_09800 [Myxococcota bacterium]